MARKSRYQPLAAYLASLEAVEWRTSFAEVERLIGKPLPKAARRDEAWWEDLDTPQARVWDRVGWEVDRADVETGTVVFRPRPADAPAPAPELDTGPRIPVSVWAVLGGVALTVAAVAAGALVKKRRESRFA